MVIVRWLTQSVSLTQYVWHWETPSCVSGPVLLIFLWMNLSLGKCGCDSFLNLFRREVFMVPVRILGNLVRVSSVFVMSDWILPYSSDVNVQTLFIKPHSRKCCIFAFLAHSRLTTESLLHLRWRGLGLFRSAMKRKKNCGNSTSRGCIKLSNDTRQFHFVNVLQN